MWISLFPCYVALLGYTQYVRIKILNNNKCSMTCAFILTHDHIEAYHYSKGALGS